MRSKITSHHFHLGLNELAVNTPHNSTLTFTQLKVCSKVTSIGNGGETIISRKKSFETKVSSRGKITWTKQELFQYC